MSTKIQNESPNPRGAFLVRPERNVLLAILKKSQEILPMGHTVRTKSIITWDDELGRERWVLDREIAVHPDIDVERNLLAWETLGYIERELVDDYPCSRLLEDIPSKGEKLPEVLLEC